MDEAEHKSSIETETSAGALHSADSKKGNTSAVGTKQGDPKHSNTRTTDAALVSTEDPVTVDKSGSSCKESTDTKSGEISDMSAKAPEQPSGGSTKSPTSARPKQRYGEDTALAGATDGPHRVPPQGGAGGPGMAMMAMMAGGGMSAMLGMPDMMAMMAKGMPDMSVMMGKGMPDMSAMMAKGMPDMSAMMGKGMSAIMGKIGKGGGGGMEMMDMMDCIIQVSLLRPDSDVSDDDDDSITVELPCPHCARFFTSNVSLKTHILVSHDREDSSLLNLHRLSIEKREKGKRSSKDGASPKQKHLVDFDKSVAAASSTTAKCSENTSNPSSAEEILLAAEPATKGVKRGREGKKASKEGDTGGAAGESESNSGESRSRRRSGEATSDSVTGSPSESRKRKALLQMQRSSSGESPINLSTKKSKGTGDASSDSESSPPTQQPSKELEVSASDKTAGDEKAQSDQSKGESSREPTSRIRHKKIRGTVKEPGSSKKESKVTTKEKEVSSDTDGENLPGKGSSRRCLRRSGGSACGDTASAAASPDVVMDSDSPTPNRRSLRSRKAN